MKTPRLLLPAEEEMLEAAFYYEQQSRILIIAVMHLRRHPAYWIERTS